MDIQQSGTDNFAHLVVGAVIIILLFAFVYPFTGGFISQDPQTAGFHYGSTSLFENPDTFLQIYLKSLEISIKSFTLTGVSNYTVLGVGRFLMGVESFLGMVFIALLSSSLANQ